MNALGSSAGCSVVSLGGDRAGDGEFLGELRTKFLRGGDALALLLTDEFLPIFKMIKSQITEVYTRQHIKVTLFKQFCQS